MTRKPSPRFVPAVLALEPRDVPAGNVTATLVGSQLRVFGDAADNTVILRGNEAGVIEVQGVGTTVNGGTAKPTFTGVKRVWVDVADGHDKVRTSNLTLREVFVYGGAGDDAIDLKGTTGTTGGLALVALGDWSSVAPPTANGNDSITVSGTTVRDGVAFFGFDGDAVYEGAGGKDSITIADTRLTVEAMYFYKNEEYSEFGAGDTVTLKNFDATIETDNSLTDFWVNGTNHDDTIRLENVRIAAHATRDFTSDMFVGSYDGNDAIDASNVRINSVTDPVEGGFNQTGIAFIADTVRIRNLDLVGGGTFTGGFSDGPYLTGGYVNVMGEDVDLRNVTVHTNGFGGLGIDTNESWVDGIPRNGSYKLRNVSVTSSYGDEGGLYLSTAGGDDRVDVKDSTFESVSIDLGDGDDHLTFVNVAFESKHFVFPWGEYGGILTGSGDDSVTLTNCDGETVYIDTGDGDDTLTLKNCAFLTADLFGGDGNDELILINCAGLFTTDGFEQ